MQPLFQFQLRPIDQVQPWGASADPNLHWFGLTDGEYWIQAGKHALFEYSDAARARSGESRFCEYQVVRLYEDVIDLAPNALEPVPRELQRYIALDSLRSWNHYWSKWREAVDEVDCLGTAPDLLDNAWSWIGRRQLDSNYLNPSTNIIVWADSDSVHIEWDNRGKLLNGHQAWSEQHGSWRMPRDYFMNEVRDFHERLMEQMAQRVSKVASGALARDVHVDREGLLKEQDVRSRSIERNLRQPVPPTDWPSVIAAIQTLEAGEH